jgi:hypothetical protein
MRGPPLRHAAGANASNDESEFSNRRVRHATVNDAKVVSSVVDPGVAVGVARAAAAVQLVVDPVAEIQTREGEHDGQAKSPDFSGKNCHRGFALDGDNKSSEIAQTMLQLSSSKHLR